MSLAVFLLAGLPGSVPQADPAGGYLYQPAFSVDYELRGPARPYVPEPGDIYLATEDWSIPRFGHLLAHSGAPHHSGIIFALPDGRMALLEAGPESTLHIRVLDLIPQITKYFATKRVWIRKRCVPLTPEQSRRLTAFALAAADRPFAAMRMTKEIGPLRSKGLLRTRLFGRPHAAHFDPDDPAPSMRKKYFCSELVTEALVAAQLLDPSTARPTSMYPRELFFGTSRIPYIRRHLDLSGWDPPARWTPFPGAPADIRPRPWIDGDAGSGLRSRP
jgi:hypothetical protein